MIFHVYVNYGCIVDGKKIVIYAFVLSCMSWGSFELFYQHTTNADCPDVLT